MVLPYAGNLTPTQLKAIFDQGNLGKHSMTELSEKGYMDPSIWGKLIGADNNGNLVWLPQDSTGRQPIVEQNSSGINSNITGLRSPTSNELHVARLAQLGVFVDGYVKGVQRVLIEVTLAAGGTLAATQLVAGATGGFYAEELHIEMEPAVANIAAFGGHCADIHIQDDAGTPAILMHGTVSNVHPVCDDRLGGVGGATQDMDIVVEAGIAGNVGASELHGYVLYRELT